MIGPKDGMPGPVMVARYRLAIALTGTAKKTKTSLPRSEGWPLVKDSLNAFRKQDWTDAANFARAAACINPDTWEEFALSMEAYVRLKNVEIPAP